MGWTDPEGSRPHLGALLLAYYAPDGRLVYAGRAGTGMNRTSYVACWRRWSSENRRRPRIHNVPRLNNETRLLRRPRTPAGWASDAQAVQVHLPDPRVADMGALLRDIPHRPCDAGGSGSR